MRERYEKIKVRAGGKRAIVAIARQLLIRMRRKLLDGTQYVSRCHGNNKITFCGLQEAWRTTLRCM